MRGRRRKRTTLKNVEHDILQHLTAGDLLVSFLVSGRSTRALYREAHKRARARYIYKRSIENLEVRGLVERRKDALRLTNKGKELLEILASRAKSTITWQNRWWLVMYDIPVSMNAYRFELRRILTQSGFRKLQHSVWIHPAPCRELEIFLRDNPTMNRYVRYLEAPPFSSMASLNDWKKLQTT
jgi:DNA-binding transcriptional regulator PaaX